jgi:tetratricopeptide (TPR) repeat protein
MSRRVAQGVILLAMCSAGLLGCSTSTKLADLGKPGDDPGTTSATNGAANPAADSPAKEGASDFPSAAAHANGDTTGSVNVQPAEPGPSGEPVKPLSKPGLLGDDPNDDLALGKRYFRRNSFGLAEKAFRTAVEKHPHDAEAWVGLAASYDRLHRFDLADRAYAEAVRIVGPTPEILNDQGFSYMLRGDYARARKKLEEAQAKDPANPYIQANLRLLEDSYREGKSVQ